MLGSAGFITFVRKLIRDIMKYALPYLTLRRHHVFITNIKKKSYYSGVLGINLIKFHHLCQAETGDSAASS